jgi:O-antigen/teichoic acid export membrane protein
MLIKEFFDKLRHSKGSGGVLARGALGVFIVKIAGAGILFGLHVLLARLLGVGQYGIYVYAITLINILAILCLLGFQTSLVRFIAEYNIKRQWGLLRGILRRSEQFVLGFSIAASLLGMIVIRVMGNRLSVESAITFYIAFCVLPFLSFCRLRAASLQALKCVTQSELLLRAIRPVFVGIVVIGFSFWLGDNLKARYAMTANLTAVICVAVIGTFYLNKRLFKAVFRTQPDFANKQWLKVSLPLLLVAGMHIILKHTDIIMIGAISNSTDAGVYSSASQISDLVVFALTSINSILAPMISELYHTGQKQELQRIIKLAARVIFVFTLTVSIILISGGKILLGMFGPEFTVAFVPLVILLFGKIINSLAGSVGFIMAMTRHQRQMGLIVTASAGVNIVLNYLLIPPLGLLGAAVSTALTMSMWNIIAVVYIQRNLGIYPTIFGRFFKTTNHLPAS